MTDNYEWRLRRDCTDMLFEQSRGGIGANLGTALLLALLLSGSVSAVFLAGWAAAMVAIAAVRWWMLRAYRRREASDEYESLHRWRWGFVAIMGLLGMTWGAGGAVFISYAQGLEQFVVTLVLGGLVVAAVPYLSPVFAAYAAYSVGLLALFALGFVVQANHSALTFAVMLLIAMLAFMSVAHTYRRKLVEALRLGYENASLVAELREYREQLEQKVAQRTEALEDANREMEAFNYSVSHDLRAPLRAIHGYGSILMQDYAKVLDGEGQRMLQRLRQASRRMDRLIDALLQLSRLSRRSINRTRVDLSALAQAAAARLRESDPGRDVEIDIQAGLSVHADRQLMGVVVDNLMSNAWKYTARNGRAHIRFGAELRDPLTVYYVADDGVGFDMQYAHKLFGAFQRLHSDEDFEGTGIGLATVARVVRRHGGDVWAESAEGEGARFYFTLPAGD